MSCAITIPVVVASIVLPIIGVLLVLQYRRDNKMLAQYRADMDALTDKLKRANNID